MRKSPIRALAAMLMALSSAFAVHAKEPKVMTKVEVNNSVLVIPANTRFPVVKKVSLGAGKSLMVQFPTPLKDVLVADPARMDAVVQSTNQVFLIAKGPGATNAFFFDQTGQQVLTLEVSIGADLSGLEDMFRKFLPGSKIVVETAGKALVLTGSVRTPLDSNRASEIAKEFAKSADGNFASNPNQVTTAQGPNGGSTTSVSLSTAGSAGNGSGQAEKPVINLLQVEGEEQVQLRVHVAEVSRSLLKQFGINLGGQFQAGGVSTSLLTENALPLTAAAGLGTLPVPGIGTEGLEAGAAVTCLTAGVLCNYNAGPAGSTAFGNSGIDGSFELGGGNRISKALRALERDGLIRTLAEPNLTAISGEAAKFLAGGEFPIPIIDSTGNISVLFKEFGVGVAFTPIVMSEGRISLKIETEVSELSTEGAVSISGFSIPALRKRQARSTVELPSGGSLAMAGLISDRVRQNIDGFPGLKDLPVLGTLFRSRDFIKDETELVVIVTPYVVRPTSRQNLALPTDGLAEASDLRAGLLGHFNRVYGKGGSQPVGDLKGDYGFIVE